MPDGVLRLVRYSSYECLIAGFWLLTRCTSGGEAPSTPLTAAGGAATSPSRRAQAYTFSISGLDSEAALAHSEGDARFEARLAVAPSRIDPQLGPYYNNSSCNGCHPQDGRGEPRLGSGFLGSELVVRIHDTHEPNPPLGRQLRDHATPGAVPPATVKLSWTEVPGTYGDGEVFRLRAPKVSVADRDGRSLSPTLVLSPRVPPPVFGLGLLEAVDAHLLVALADPEDADHDGISGRVNLVTDIGTVTKELTVGRFGWKAGVATLAEVSARAFADDLGVSNRYFPETDGSHELEDQALHSMTVYMQTLSVPARADTADPLVRAGEQLFADIGCESCHIATLHTGASRHRALANQEIHPYTDLLLHNMGFDLADGFPEGDATGTEWRTAPLWGIGLAQVVSPNVPFLHDGRARTLAEAILWHGGEAQMARESFRMLSASKRQQILAFLESL